MPRTVLVRRRALGDVVLLGSVAAALPGEVVVVTEARYVEVAARLAGVARVVPFGDPVPAGRVVDLQRDLRTVWAFPGAGRVRKHSLARWLGWGRPDVPALYGRACGVAPVPPPWIRTAPAVRDALALVPGASCGPKRWSPQRFAAVGARWAGPVVVVGGPAEEALVGEVAAQIPGAVAVCGPGFAAAIEAFGRSRVAVGGDTGLVHLAAACGARPVALFGPTHPRDGFFPYDGVALGLELPCRPCTRHRIDACPVGHHGCMGIDVPTVTRAVSACAGS
jgi:ADP-heptose:LPS heptosyltransferase